MTEKEAKDNMKLYKRGKTWYADLRHTGRGRVSTGCADYNEAQRWVKRELTGRGNGQNLADALTKAFTDHYQGSKGARNVLSQMHVIKQAYGDTLIKDIDTPWMMTFIEAFKVDRTPATVNRYTALMSKVLKLATQWGWIEGVPYIPRARESAGRVRVLTDVEETKLLAHFSEHCRWMLNLSAFLLDTGARLGEAIGMDEKSRHRAAEEVSWTIWETKSGRPRTIPLTTRARLVLTDVEGWWGGKSTRAAQAHWTRAREALGLAGDTGFVIHCLRHTCATRMVDRGVDLPVIRDFLGHSSVTVTERYAHLNPNSLKQAVNVLEPAAGPISLQPSTESLHNSLHNLVILQ